MFISSAACRWRMRERVFETVSAALGSRIKRIPDGETGERGRLDHLARAGVCRKIRHSRNPASFFASTRAAPAASAIRLKPGRRRRGRALRQSVLRRHRRRSPMRSSSRLKDAGKIPPGTKFQVDLVPAHSVIWLFLVRTSCTLRSTRSTTTRVKREIDKIAAIDPARRTRDPVRRRVRGVRAARTQRGGRATAAPRPRCRTTFAGILTDLGNRVPADVDLLYHFCYGDSGHRHVVEPTDMGDMVEFANRADRGGIARPIELIHMPVPRDRADDAYFAPLRRLELRPETELCLGLVHYTDGVDGARRAAWRQREKYVSRFFHRHRVRLRPPRSGDDSGAAAPACRDCGSGLTTRTGVSGSHRARHLCNRTTFEPRWPVSASAIFSASSSSPNGLPMMRCFVDAGQGGAVGKAGDEQHRQRRLRALNSARHFGAVHSRHGEIDEQQIDAGSRSSTSSAAPPLPASRTRDRARAASRASPRGPRCRRRPAGSCRRAASGHGVRRGLRVALAARRRLRRAAGKCDRGALARAATRCARRRRIAWRSRAPGSGQGRSPCRLPWS